MAGKKKPTTITAYIAAAPKEARGKLREIRAILKSVAPKATEAIKWGSPVLEQRRILFAYSAFKTHLNFMTTGPAMKPFKKELEGYTTGKDTVQFKYDEPLPTSLIRRMAKHRMNAVLNDDAKWMYGGKKNH